MLHALLIRLGLRRPAAPAPEASAPRLFERPPLPTHASAWAMDAFLWACAKTWGRGAGPGLNRVPPHFRLWLATLGLTQF